MWGINCVHVTVLSAESGRCRRERVARIKRIRRAVGYMMVGMNEIYRRKVNSLHRRSVRDPCRCRLTLIQRGSAQFRIGTPTKIVRHTPIRVRDVVRHMICSTWEGKSKFHPLRRLRSRGVVWCRLVRSRRSWTWSSSCRARRKGALSLILCESFPGHRCNSPGQHQSMGQGLHP